MAGTGVMSSFSRRIIDCGMSFVGYLVYLQLRPALPAALEMDKAKSSPFPELPVVETSATVPPS
jgi:hypothetical protein